MKAYRPRHPAWQPISNQVASRANKRPPCFGRRNPRAILCGRCAWADDCPIDPARLIPPPEKIQGLIPPGEPCSGMVRRYCGHCHGDAIGQFDHRMNEYRCLTCHSILPPNQTPPPGHGETIFE